MRNPILAFFIGSLFLAMICVVIIGWPAELQAITDLLENSGTNPMDFALMLFVFGEVALFMGIGLASIAGRR